MKLRIALFVCCSTALTINAIPLALQDQEDVRGAFITSRPKEKPVSTSNTPKPTHRRPKPVVSDNKNNSANNSGNTGVEVKTTTKNTKPDNKGTVVRPVNTQRLGLGLTLFTRDATGLAVRADPNRVFQKGDRVRVLLETNTDGFLYIFNTTNDGPPVMIYPNADLFGGGNYLQAHVPFEIPSSDATEERLRWLVFDENAGNERLFFVFTKEPLLGLPIEDDLVALCRDSKSACPVRPTADVWLQIETESKHPLQSDTSAQNGIALSKAEQQGTRGIGLAKDDPQPSLIMMASAKTATLVTTLDLIHR